MLDISFDARIDNNLCILNDTNWKSHFIHIVDFFHCDLVLLNHVVENLKSFDNNVFADFFNARSFNRTCNDGM